MVEKVVDIDIINIIKAYIKEISKYYEVDKVILFGSYAKGTYTEDSDIDIAIISKDIRDRFDDMAKLMSLTWDIDVRIEPHPIKKEEFKEKENPFIDEIIKTGINIEAA